MYRDKKLGWANLLVGIIFIIAAITALRNPEGNIKAIVLIIAITAIAKGIMEIFIRSRLNDLTGFHSKTMTITGVLDIIVGIVLMMNLSAGALVLLYIFALWFIIDAIEGFLTLDIAKYIGGSYYYSTLIINILGLIIGVFLLFSPETSALTIALLLGVNLMLVGIWNIVKAFKQFTY